ncbi:hypothetical protein [Methylotenera versatilis]|uniref:hypothetical protein n=1 Tax=Methylotenera versatilis TaxID=1055487 RepID=UPI00068C578D|nr:hypothetical protein [Methylotenera versatilis]
MTIKTKIASTSTSTSTSTRISAEAKLLNSASMMSAITSEAISKSMCPNLELSDLINVLNSKINNVQSGDMSDMEAMLVGQAHALQTIFVSLARRSVSQEYVKNYGIFMNLALKAQSQSRSTIQALIELKYPKQVAFVKQANISHGHQQVNNGNGAQLSAHEIDPSCAGENQNQPNELLEVCNGSQTMDISAATTTSRVDKAMATMEK